MTADATIPASGSPGIRPYHVLMSLVFAVALSAAWSMLPGDEERIAMLERDGQSRQALEILEASYAAGDRSYRKLHHMLGLYEDQGDTAKAQAILEAMVVARPRDAALRGRLASFYRDTGNSKERSAALKAQIETRYSEGACRELISILRLDGRAQEEAETIRSCRQKGYRRAEDLARLAGIEAVDGDVLAGSGLLRSIDDVRRLRDTEDRYQLMSLLLDLNQPREAARRAIRWINASKDQSFAVGLIDQLARSKYPDAAIEVAKEAGRAGDGISLTVAERLTEQAQPQVARLYLRGWLDNAQFESEDVVARFIEAALEVRDPALALAGARKYGLGKLPPAAVQTLATALMQSGMKAEGEEVRAAVPGVADLKSEDETSGPAELKSGAAIPRNGPGVAARVQTVTLEGKDPLDVWRRSLLTRLSDEARRKAAGLGLPLPRHGSYERGDIRAESHTRVLKKTTKILQRNRKLKSLKMKQKLVREGSGGKSRKP